MNIKILETEKNFLRFEIDGTNPAFVNSLRRTMLSRISTLAIDDVTFIKNGSGLFDESLAHRLGLIPWTFDLKNLKEDDEIEMSLKAKGPMEVKAKDIKTPKGINPVNPDLLVISLFKDQEVDLEAKARLGKGTEHIKWQSAVVAYQYYPEIKIGHVKNVDEILAGCPNNVFEVKNGKLEVKRIENCSLCLRCQELSDGEITVKDRPDRFIFTVESVSGLKPKEIVLEALKILQGDVSEFQDNIKSLKMN